MLVEGDGGPLGVCIAAAHVHDVRLLKDTLDAVVVERPEPTSDEPQHLCLDKGYDSSGGYRVILEQGYVPHVRRIGQEKLDEGGQQKHPARRWVVERTFAWLSRCRGILIRWDKKAECYLALVKLACALLWFRRLHRLKQTSDAVLR